jgi:hypothetical protein
MTRHNTIDLLLSHGAHSDRFEALNGSHIMKQKRTMFKGMHDVTDNFTGKVKVKLSLCLTN